MSWKIGSLESNLPGHWFHSAKPARCENPCSLSFPVDTAHTIGCKYCCMNLFKRASIDTGMLRAVPMAPCGQYFTQVIDSLSVVLPARAFCDSCPTGLPQCHRGVPLAGAMAFPQCPDSRRREAWYAGGGNCRGWKIQVTICGARNGWLGWRRENHAT